MMYWNTPGGQDYDNLFSGAVDPGDYLLLLPVLVVLSASLLFMEQDNDTLKNMLTVPVSFPRLMTGKLTALGIIALLLSLYTVLVTLLVGLICC
jgi:bacitracin transport system permease protein